MGVFFEQMQDVAQRYTLAWQPDKSSISTVRIMPERQSLYHALREDRVRYLSFDLQPKDLNPRSYPSGEEEMIQTIQRTKVTSRLLTPEEIQMVAESAVNSTIDVYGGDSTGLSWDVDTRGPHPAAVIFSTLTTWGFTGKAKTLLDVARKVEADREGGRRDPSGD